MTPFAPIKTVLHRHVWQRLPYRLRRSALFRGAALLAPRPSAGVRPALPIYVVGTFRTASGLGQSARLCRDALLAAGWPVKSIDITEPMMQPVDGEQGVAFEPELPPGSGVVVLHINAPLVPLAMLRLGRNTLRDKYIIGSWAWELPHAPPDWRRGVEFVHEIWMPAQYGRDAVAPIAAGRPVHVVPHAVLTGRRPVERDRTTPRPFTVLLMFSMASSFERKNPLAAIAAFRRAFGDDPGVRFLIKTSRVDAYPLGVERLRNAIGDARNIEVDDRVLPAADIDRIYAQADAVISLHRSEGFGLLVAEAMIHGIPVVATDWSATTDFLDRTCGFPVPFTLTPARDPQGTYDHPGMLWADADVKAAAEALRTLRHDPELRTRLGEAGAARARNLWSVAAYASAVSRRLGLELPSR